MSVTKNILKRDFSQIPNELITDKNISHGAFRVMVYLLSKPDGWQVYNNDIKKKLKISKSHTIAKYWKELEESGWISRTKTSKGAFDYILNEKPVAQNGHEEEKACCLKRASAHNEQLPKMGTNNNTNSLSNTDFNNKTNKRPPTACVDQKLIEEKFMYLWENQGLRKVSKEPAKKAFIKLCKTRWKTKEKITEATVGIIEDIAERIELIGDKKSPFKNKHLSTYLNNNGWKDEETEIWE